MSHGPLCNKPGSPCCLREIAHMCPTTPLVCPLQGSMCVTSVAQHTTQLTRLFQQACSPVQFCNPPQACVALLPRADAISNGPETHSCCRPTWLGAGGPEHTPCRQTDHKLTTNAAYSAAQQTATKLGGMHTPVALCGAAPWHSTGPTEHTLRHVCGVGGTTGVGRKQWCVPHSVRPAATAGKETLPHQRCAHGMAPHTALGSVHVSAAQKSDGRTHVLHVNQGQHEPGGKVSHTHSCTQVAGSSHLT